MYFDFDPPSHLAEIIVYLNWNVESDWAGCHRTRKSTSGIVVKLLDCPVVSDSKNGTVIRWSWTACKWTRNFRSALCKEHLAWRQTHEASQTHWASRCGSGKKPKHIELCFLYTQDLVARGDLQLKKVHTTVNCADPLTKYWDGEKWKSHIGRLGVGLSCCCFAL